MVERIRQGDIPGVQLRLRRSLPLTTEEIWLRLTDPGLASGWLAERVEVHGDDGGTILLTSRFEDHVVRERGVVEESLPLARWSLSFERLEREWPAPTRVTFEIQGTASGGELSVLHEGFQRLALSECLTIWEFYRRRWRWALERLRAEAGGG